MIYFARKGFIVITSTFNRTQWIRIDIHKKKNYVSFEYYGMDDNTTTTVYSSEYKIILKYYNNILLTYENIRTHIICWWKRQNISAGDTFYTK